MGSVGRKGDEKYSLICTTCLSFLCLFSLSIGERKLIVGMFMSLVRRGMMLVALYPRSSR
jgi:hypothetical protein